MNSNGKLKHILFPVGQIVATPGALAAFEKSAMKHPSDHPMNYIARHSTGDWGDLDEHDQEVNKQALKYGARLFSKYSLKDETEIWVITEADRSSTTILLPDEY